MSDFTRVLNAIEEGEAQASEQLLPLVYEELRQLAARKLAREKAGQTLQATALVHEAYLKLVAADGDVERPWPSRGHFFKAAAEAMRRILVDNARRKLTIKHGGALNRRALPEADVAADAPLVDLITLNEALDRFAQEAPEKCHLVQLRYFAGLTLQQAADAMGLSRSTADRYWAYARAWLLASMSDRNENSSL